jgi:hypothetical protein
MEMLKCRGGGNAVDVAGFKLMEEAVLARHKVSSKLNYSITSSPLLNC